MLTTEDLRRRPPSFRSLTGLTVAQFEQLYQEVAARYAAAEAARLTRPQRQRAPGAGRKFRRPLEDRLLMALLWLRLYPSYAALGVLLGFVLGRIWEIRLQMRLEQAKQRGLELTEHEITEAAVQH